MISYKKLGNSGLEVSEIGFGCMSLKGGLEDNQALIMRAFDLGINFFDTADLYDKGNNEIILGKALSSIREKVVLATKVGNRWRPDGKGWDWDPRKEYILQAAEASLQRLQTDYIDLYQLHGGTIDDPFDETIEAFELLKQQGKIRCYGISSIRPNVIRTLVHKTSITSVMMQYSLLDRRPEETCFEIFSFRGIALLVRGSLAQGLLAGKPPAPYLKYGPEEVQRVATLVGTLSGPSRTPAQTALRFVLACPFVTSAVVGLRTREQLEEVVQTLGTKPLTGEEIKSLRSALPLNFYEQHR